MKKQNTQKYEKRKNCNSKPYDLSHYLESNQKPIDLQGVKRLSIELTILKSNLLHFPEERDIRIKLFERIKNDFQNIIFTLENKEIATFSINPSAFFQENIFLSTSEIDVIFIEEPIDFKDLNLKQNKKSGQKSNCLLFYNHVLRALNNFEYVDKNSIVFLNSKKLRKIKFKDKEFGFGFNVYLKTSSFFQQTKFIRSKIRECPFVRDVYILLTYYFFVRNMDSTFNDGICQEVLFLMILHFTELHPLVQLNIMDVSHSLGAFLMDFFQFYGRVFNHDKACLAFGKHEHNPYYMKKRDVSGDFHVRDPIDKTIFLRICEVNYLNINKMFQHSYKIMLILLSSKIQSNKELLCVWMRYDYAGDIIRKEIRCKFKELYDLK